MKVALIGAGGHARTLINILELNQYEIMGVYDDHYSEEMQGELVEGYPLIGGLDAIAEDQHLIIAKGNCLQLKTLSEQFKAQLLSGNLIHPKAVIELSNESIGIANQISALCYAAKSSIIGNHNLIYSQSTLEHEVVIGDYNVITVNVTICGRVRIGSQCYFGASSTVLPKISICDGVTIGAGAVVTKDITEPGTYVGIPAKKLEK